MHRHCICRVEHICEFLQVCMHECLLPHQFIGVFGPCQVADLGASVCALQRLTRQSVPEAQATVGSAAP